MVFTLKTNDNKQYKKKIFNFFQFFFSNHLQGIKKPATFATQIKRNTPL